MKELNEIEKTKKRLIKWNKEEKEFSEQNSDDDVKYDDDKSNFKKFWKKYI
jgi:hypothetical protein